MKFKLEIDLDNAAFGIDPEQTAISALALSEVLQDLANRLNVEEVIFDTAYSGAKIRDINGNTCGHWQITEEN